MVVFGIDEGIDAIVLEKHRIKGFVVGQRLAAVDGHNRNGCGGRSRRGGRRSIHLALDHPSHFFLNHLRRALDDNRLPDDLYDLSRHHFFDHLRRRRGAASNQRQDEGQDQGQLYQAVGPAFALRLSQYGAQHDA